MDFSEFKELALKGYPPESIEVQLFAIVREFAKIKIGLFPNRAQLLAALVLSRENVVQMNTGEGKTLVIPFFAILEKLYARRVVVVTPNDYLSKRDAQWMGPLYQALGVTVGTVQEDMGLSEKFRTYSFDVIYVSTSRIVFDYLNKCYSLTPDVDFPISQETLILDEVDHVLLDQGLQPYILANPIDFQSNIIPMVMGHISEFVRNVDFEAILQIKDIQFTNIGYAKVSALASPALYPQNPSPTWQVRNRTENIEY